MSDPSYQDQAIEHLLVLLRGSTPALQPSAEVLITLVALLKLRGQAGDYEALAVRFGMLEKKLELLGVREIPAGRRRFGVGPEGA